MYVTSLAAWSGLSNPLIFHCYVVAYTRTRGYSSFYYIEEENTHKPPLYGTWCVTAMDAMTPYIYIRIQMKFCNPAFLETITGSLTC